MSAQPAAGAGSWALPRALLLAYVAVFAVLGIEPYDRGAWALEHLLVFVAIAIFIAT